MYLYVWLSVRLCGRGGLLDKWLCILSIMHTPNQHKSSLLYENTTPPVFPPFNRLSDCSIWHKPYFHFHPHTLFDHVSTMFFQRMCNFLSIFPPLYVHAQSSLSHQAWAQSVGVLAHTTPVEGRFIHNNHYYMTSKQMWTFAPSLQLNCVVLLIFAIHPLYSALL